MTNTPPTASPTTTVGCQYAACTAAAQTRADGWLFCLEHAATHLSELAAPKPSTAGRRPKPSRPERSHRPGPKFSQALVAAAAVRLSAGEPAHLVCLDLGLTANETMAATADAGALAARSA